MGNKLYVANLAFHITEAELQDAFSRIGPVEDVKIILDKLTGKSRGFAFISMGSDADAERAITDLNGQQFEGRALAVTEARPREERPPGFRPSGGGGGAPRPPGGGGGYRPPGGGGGQRPSGGWTDGANRGGPRKDNRGPRGPRPQRDNDDY